MGRCCSYCGAGVGSSTCSLPGPDPSLSFRAGQAGCDMSSRPHWLCEDYTRAFSPGVSPCISQGQETGVLSQFKRRNVIFAISSSSRSGTEEKKQQQTTSGMLLSICSSLKGLCMVPQLRAKHSRAALGCLSLPHSDGVLRVCKELPSSRDMNHSLLTG